MWGCIVSLLSSAPARICLGGIVGNLRGGMAVDIVGACSSQMDVISAQCQSQCKLFDRCMQTNESINEGTAAGPYYRVRPIDRGFSLHFLSPPTRL